MKTTEELEAELLSLRQRVANLEREGSLSGAPRDEMFLASEIIANRDVNAWQTWAGPTHEECRAISPCGFSRDKVSFYAGRRTMREEISDILCKYDPHPGISIRHEDLLKLRRIVGFDP